jgi:8-amino-7-oxononanoate synthase
VTAPPSPLRHLDRDLAALAEQGLLREPHAPASTTGSTEGPALLDLCSNDYLGYARDPWPELGVRSGAGASRLVTGNLGEHMDAEGALASWLGTESALLFSSGYAANVGVLTALAGPGDLIVSDALNHASIIDGCRLSGASVRVTPHLDLDAVARALSAGPARRRWVVTESYFSMDGDSPDLAGLRAVCDAHDAALILDEAHALGVFGPEGRGLAASAGVQPDVLVGTAGKALGLHGAFVVGSRSLCRWLWNRARSFVFSTGISPALAAAIRARVIRVRADAAARARVHAAAQRIRGALAETQGADRVRGHGPIIPWVIGDPAAAVAASGRLRERGILARPIRPPTVPAGTSRLRITATAALSEAELAMAVDALRQARP